MSALLIPSPLEKLDDLFGRPGEFFIKREDKIHPEYGGNKWRKLKFNLEKFRKEGYRYLVTFGGPFSNHIAATASLCRDENIACVACVRGEYRDANNPTLKKAAEDGMMIFPFKKEDYQIKEHSKTVKEILKSFPNHLIIPEGGNNPEGMKGASVIMQELTEQAGKALNIFIAVGSGTTAAGIIRKSNSEDRIYVINTMKNPGLAQVIQQKTGNRTNWTLVNDYHMGGFAKTSPKLISFIREFYERYQIALDPLYTGKMMFALSDMSANDGFDRKRKTIAIHTGGLQGIRAFNYVQGNEADKLRFEGIS